MQGEIPEEVQKKYQEFQMVQQQVQSIMGQLRQYEMRIQEVSDALDMVNSVPEDAPVYRTVGGIMARAKSPESVATDLKEEKELLEVRTASIKKQEEALKERFAELQKELQALASGSDSE